MKFLEFCEYLEKIENLASRNEMTVVLSEMISSLSENEIDKAMYLLLGRLTPKFDTLEFNFSSKLMIKSLNSVTNEQNVVKDIYKEKGDIGLTSQEINKKFIQNSSEKLEISYVYDNLTQIAKLEGSGSQTAKSESFLKLFKKLSPTEAKFVSRIIVGKLRLGVSEKTLLDAFSWAVKGDKSFKKYFERAFGVNSDIGFVGKLLKQNSEADLIKVLENQQIKPGVPVASKLVEREKSVEKVFERTGKCYVQPKLDGLRAQIHAWEDDGEYFSKIFSRNMEPLSDMFPEILEASIQLLKDFNISSIVLDSEAIGVNQQTGEYLDFQTTIQRRRKHNVNEKAKEIPIKAMCFDVLHYNGKDISHEDIEKRTQILEKVTGGSNNKTIDMLETRVCDTEQKLNDFFEDCVTAGLEGVIVKTFGTYYEPGTRNYDWIKLKASIKKDMVDTVDAVVLGYYLGTGVRAKFGLGAILIGTYNEATDKFETIAKVGTGITDDQFKEIKSDLDQITLGSQPGNINVVKDLTPDVFVKPEIVVEVEADEITRSKMHTASQKEGKGLSMRFPRLKIWNRKDKDVSSITSPEELEKMFKLNKT